MLKFSIQVQETTTKSYTQITANYLLLWISTPTQKQAKIYTTQHSQSGIIFITTKC
jgi:hypothetical protein